MINITSLDLTQRPPRSPRVTLGGYVLLPAFSINVAQPSPVTSANSASAPRAWIGTS
jgi:hypothetical protein